MAKSANTLLGGNVVDTRTFARWMRARREEAGLSQDQVRVKCDLSLAYVNKIENGRVVPSLKVAQEIAKVLDPNTGVAELIELLAKPESDDPETKDEEKLRRAFRSRDIDTCIRIISKYAA